MRNLARADFTVVSFFTRTWQYADHAQRLRAECEALNLDHHIVERPDQGDYLANTRLKPYVIREAMEELDRPVLWVDVDGSILRVPDALCDVDFMACPMPVHRPRTWHVGTLFFHATDKARALAALWSHLAERGSDEAALEAAWTSDDRPHGLRYAPLPSDCHHVLGPGKRPPPGTVICHRLSTGESKMRLHGRIK